MALTIENADHYSDDVWGRTRVRIVDVTFDSSYATGGESLTPADVALAEILGVVAIANGDGYVFDYDTANEKILAYGVQQDADAAVTDPLDEEDSTADLSGVTVTLLVIGR